jgi:hypothetical protein
MVFLFDKCTTYAARGIQIGMENNSYSPARLHKMSNKVDRLVMLLSSDWFLSHWSLIGLSIEEKSKNIIYNGCRILTKEFVGKANKYWLVSFSEDRVKETKENFIRLLESSAIKKHDYDLLMFYVEESLLKEDNDSINSMLSTINDHFIDTDEFNQVFEGQENLRIMISNNWMTLGENDNGINTSFEISKSSWDSYLKSLTADIPTYLIDYLSIEILSANKFKIFWLTLKNNLKENEVDFIKSAYKKMADEFMGREITLA